jgi:hypothetical protein
MPGTDRQEPLASGSQDMVARPRRGELDLDRINERSAWVRALEATRRNSVAAGKPGAAAYQLFNDWTKRAHDVTCAIVKRSYLRFEHRAGDR